MIAQLAHRILDILGFPPEPPESTPLVVSQAAWHDAARERLAAMRASEKAIWRERLTAAQLVGSWATATVSARCRAIFPRIKGRAGAEIALWLPGLNAAEIMKIATTPADDVIGHLFEGRRIAGVRPVQPLEECMLIWPKPVLNPDQQQAGGGGGGPRRR
jgi:hypothetical protein